MQRGGQDGRRDSNIGRGSTNPSLPVTRPVIKKTSTTEVKTVNRLSKQSQGELQGGNSSILDSNKRSFPVESKMVQMTQIKDIDPESSLNQDSMRSIDKNKSFLRDDYSRSRSQMADRVSVLRGTEEKSQFARLSQISTPTQQTPPGTNRISQGGETLKDREQNESILGASYTRRTPDINRPMETRRNGEAQDVAISVLSTGVNSTLLTEAVGRRRLSIARLIMAHTEGDDDFFEGSMIKGKKHGFCRVLSSNSVYKEGFFANNCLDGEALIRFPHGISVQGVFKANMLSANIVLTIDNTSYPIDFVQGEWHNDQLFVSDKNVLVVTYQNCKDISEYNDNVRVYFRNGYRLDCKFEKGAVSQNHEAVLFDKFNTPFSGFVKHGINFESNGIAVFTAHGDKDEYMMQFKGEGTVIRKKKRGI